MKARSPTAPGTPADPRDILRKIRRLELRTRRLVASRFAGQYHSVFKGQGMNFEEVREYTPGDDVRAIDWNVTARMNAPYIKKFTEEREMTVMLAVDVSASGIYGSVALSKREVAAEAAAILAFSAIFNNDKVGLLLFTDRVELLIPPRKGRQHILRLIREMLYFQPAGRLTDIAGPLERLEHVLPRRALVFLISDFLAPDFSRELAVAAARHDVVAVALRDPAEDALPDAGWVVWEDAETGELVEIHTSSARVREAFRRAASERRRALEKLFASRHVDLVTLSTTEDCLLPLRAFFKRRERRLAA